MTRRELLKKSSVGLGMLGLSGLLSQRATGSAVLPERGLKRHRPSSANYGQREQMHGLLSREGPHGLVLDAEDERIEDALRSGVPETAILSGWFNSAPNFEDAVRLPPSEVERPPSEGGAGD